MFHLPNLSNKKNRDNDSIKTNFPYADDIIILELSDIHKVLCATSTIMTGNKYVIALTS